MKTIRNTSSGIAICLAILFTVIGGQKSFSQGVGISEAGITPDPSSILELRSVLRGFLAPRMTTVQRGAIASPATGLIIYNTDTNTFNYYNGTVWIDLLNTGTGVSVVNGTLNRISVGGTPSVPVIDIDPNYIGQASITTLGTISSGTWNGTTLAIANGGTGQTTQQAAINSLAGGVTSGQYLRGNGANIVLSGIQVADVPVLNQSSTGTANIAGGTLGAIPYQIASNTTGVLASTATANKVLMSGASAAPVWSTPTFPNISATSRKIIVSNGTNWTASTETYAVPGASGNLLVSDGINWTSTLPTFDQNTTGNAATATKLASTKNINGVAFDGSANITVPVNSVDDLLSAVSVYPLWTTAAGNNAAKISTTKLSFVPSTGILTAIGFSGSGAGLTNIPNGSLSNNSMTIGTTNIALGGTSTTLAGLTSVTSASFTGALTGNVTGNVFGTSANVTGTVLIANGGTGQTTQQAAINALAGGATSGQYLRGNGANIVLSGIQVADVPILNQNTTGNAATATIANNLAAGAQGSIPYQTAANTTTMLAKGTAGQVLAMNAGATAPVWSNVGSGDMTLAGAQTVTGVKTFSVAPIFSTLTLGSVPFAGASGVLSQDNANLFWDNTNKWLGIGTASPSATLTVLGDVNINPTGSTTGTPRNIGITSWNAGNAVRFMLGNAWNSLQNAYSYRMQITAFNGIDIAGNRESPTPLGFVAGAFTDASLNVVGTAPAAPVLTVTSAAGQLGNMQEWRNSTGTVLASITSAGAISGLNGVTIVNGLKGSGGTPGITPDVGAGTGPTMGISGTNLGGKITITTGTGPVAGVLMTIAFANSLSFPNGCSVQLSAGNLSAAQINGANKPYISATNLTNFIISVPVALTATTQYIWYYQVIGY